MRLITRTRMKKATLGALAAASVVLAGACTIDRGDGAVGDSTAAEQSKDTKDKQDPTDDLTFSFKDKATEVSVVEPVTVKGKKIEKVTMTNSAGGEVEGKLNSDKTQWTTDEKLAYGETYTLAVKAGGETVKKSFTTVQASMVSSTGLSPLDQSTVGVAQSVSLFFDAPVTNKKAVQEAIDIETSNNTEGAFYWLTDQSLRWRPKEFWQPGTKVTVNADLYGLELSDGVYGDEDRSATFTIGDDVRAVVDDSTKTMTVTKNGETIKTMPVSNGRDTDQWATPNGIYTVGDQYDNIVMDSNTFGFAPSEGGYVTPVNWATQLSWSGIYIHAAPWSVYAQGNTNTSHGCVNVSDENAQWVYNNLKRGDVVEITNTVGGQLNGHDGLGDWQIPWSEWSKGNATAN